MDINEARQKLPALAGLDDDSFVGALQQLYYPDRSTGEIAQHLGVTLTPPPPPPRPAASWGDRAADTGIALTKGAIGVPEAVVGAADLVTGGAAGKLAESAGFRPKEAKAMLEESLSPAQKYANDQVQHAEGLWNTFKAAVSNPSVVAQSVVESLPAMGAGGVVARGALALAPGMSAVMAGAAGEGAIQAGQAAEQSRQDSPDGMLTSKAAGAAVASGVIDTAIARFSGGLAKKLGLADVDTMLAGAAVNPKAAKGVVRSALGGMVTEGLIEELPQSVQEQVWANYAAGKPLDEGVNQAAVLGTLSGGLMGGGANIVSRMRAPPKVTPEDVLNAPTVDDAIAAMNKGLAETPLLPPPTIAVTPAGTAVTPEQRAAMIQAEIARRTGAAGGDIEDVTAKPVAGTTATAEPAAAAPTTTTPPAFEDPFALPAGSVATSPQALAAPTATPADLDAAEARMHRDAERDSQSMADRQPLQLPRRGPTPPALDVAIKPGDLLGVAGSPMTRKGAELKLKAKLKDQGTLVEVQGGWLVRPNKENPNGSDTGNDQTRGATTEKPAAGAGSVGERSALLRGAAVAAPVADSPVGAPATPAPAAQEPAGRDAPAGAPALAGPGGAAAAVPDRAGVPGAAWTGATPKNRQFYAERAGLTQPKGAALKSWAKFKPEQQQAILVAMERQGDVPRISSESDKSLSDKEKAPLSGRGTIAPKQVEAAQPAAAQQPIAPPAVEREASAAPAPREAISAKPDLANIAREVMRGEAVQRISPEEAQARSEQVAAAQPRNDATGQFVESAAAPAPPAARPKRESKAARTAREAEEARAAYFAPGNVVHGYGGFDEVLDYNPPAQPGGAWSVRVHEVKEKDGKWIRVGKPQDARHHSTQPDARELAAGPKAKLDATHGREVPYSEPRADGAAFNGAPARGAAKEGGEPAMAQAEPEFFQDTQQQPGRMQVPELQALADSIASAWENKPKITALPSAVSDGAPTKVRQEAVRRMSRGGGMPKAVYYGGEVYLFADAIRDDVEAATYLYHEMGHFGMHGHFGADLDNELAAIVRTRPGEIRRMYERTGVKKSAENDIRMGEEVAAYLSQTQPKLPLVKRIIAAIRNFLRDHVPGFKNLTMSDSDIVEKFVLPARRHVEGKGYAAAGAQDSMQPAFSQKPVQTESEAFKKWFGDSKVVDEKGAPLVMYHGTKADFTAFDTTKAGSSTGHPTAQLGIFFTADPEVAAMFNEQIDEAQWPAKLGAATGANTMPVYLNIRKPYVMSMAKFRELDTLPFGPDFELEQPEAAAKQRGYMAANRAKLEAGGYDGVHIVGDSKLADSLGSSEWRADTWIAFEPNQIKSATGNNGEFDPNSADIRFAQGETESIALLKSEQATIEEKMPAIKKVAPEARLEDGKLIVNKENAARVRSILGMSAVGGNEPMFAQGEPLNDPRAHWGRAKQALADMSDAPGTMHWWNKSIGTEYHLAQKYPQFKAVFDRVQDFINDASFYANESADLARTILPKLEGWRDVVPKALGGSGKAPISAAFNRQISAPINEGTLMWTRGEDGKPVKVDDLEKAASRMSADDMAQSMLRAGKIPEGVLKMWRGMSLDQYQQTVTTAYKNRMLAPGIVWTDEELKSQFGLGKAQIGLYREFRAAVDKSITQMAISDLLRYVGEDAEFIRDQVLNAPDVMSAAKMLTDQLDQLIAEDPKRQDVLNKTAATVKTKAEKARDLMERGYAPLSRFGHYTVTVRAKGEGDEPGEVLYFGMYESRSEAAKAARALAQEEEFKGATLTRGTLSHEQYKLFAGVNPDTIELFGEMLGLEGTGNAASDKAYQTFLKAARSTRSTMKRMIHRKGTAGFSEDVPRVLAAFLYSNARQTSRNLHSLEIDRMGSAIDQQEGELKDHAIKLIDYVKNPVEEAYQLRGLLFAQFLGGSIASAMVNMSQPFMMTLPYLSQFGARKAVSNFKWALGNAWKEKTGDADLDAAIKRRVDDGTIAPHEVHQLLQQSLGKGELKSGDGTALGEAAAHANNALARLQLGWGKFFSTAELFNRRVTYVAAWKLAKENGNADPDAFAKKAVDETQGIYCVDEETEILTLSGWKRHTELKTGETVYAVDKAGALVESPLVDVYRFRGPLPATSWQTTTGFGMVLTDGHQCIVQNYNSRDKKWQRLLRVKAKDVKRGHHFLRVPLADATSREAIYTDDEVRLFAWVAAEGHLFAHRNVKEKRGVGLVQSLTHNPEYVSEIDAVLDRLGGHYNRKQSKKRARGDVMVCWQLRKPLWLKIHEALPGKMLSPELVTKLTVPQMRIFLETFTKGDGHFPDEGGEQIGQKDIGNLDALQAMAVLSGRSSTKYDRMGGHDFGVLYVAKCSVRAHSHALRRTPVMLDMAWCPETEHGTWIARRNGRTFVTGNSKGNKPVWARGAVGSVAMTFKQYSISYLEFVSRMWNAGEPGTPERAAGRRAVYFAAAMLLMMGGAGGLPFEDDVSDVVDGVMQRLGYNWNTKQKRQELLEQAFGRGLGHVIEKGVSGLPGVPIDVAGRFGMGNLIPATGLLTKKSDHTSDVLELGGPAAALAQRMFQAGNLAAAGKFIDAGVLASPVAASNIAKAIDMASSGIYKDQAGNKVMDVDAYDAMAKAVGFQPSAVAQVQEADRSARVMIDQARMRESEIAKQWAQAIAQGDQDGQQAAREAIADWNSKNEATPIKIKLGDVLKRAKNLMLDRATRIEKAAPREVREEARRLMKE